MEKAKKLIFDTLTPNDKVCVAVSGGADSMCLISLILHCENVNKSTLSIVNIDHKIRGENSSKDSRFVCGFARRNNITFKHVCVDVPALCALSGRSIEQEAREARYEVFDGLIKSGAADYVLTAHHESDNAETLLLHLFRGSGLNGLKGMEILRGERYFRPLLTTSKSEILEYLAENNIDYIDDETNSENEYSRNYLRNVVLPSIKRRWVNADNALISFAAEVCDTERFLDGLLDIKLIHKIDDNTVSIDSAALNSDKVLASRYVFFALKQLCIYSDIARKNINDVIALNKTTAGTKLNLPQNLTAIKEYDKVVLSLIPIKKTNDGDSKIFALGKTEFLESVICAAVTEETDYKKAGALFFDGDKIPECTVYRARRDGDIFSPYGGGTKKLKEYLIDKKIPQRLRGALIILAHGQEALAVLGVEISDKVKVTSATKRIVKIQISKE